MSFPINLDLKGLFEGQDKAAGLNIERSELLRKALSFLSETIRLNLHFLGSQRFESAEKATAIRTLAVDSISHLVVAVRVGLWGAIPQSIGVLRSALEGASVLASVVFYERYQTAIAEINKKLDQIQFKAALRSLGPLGDDIERLWGRMSDFGAHASAKRIRHTTYIFEGDEYDRLGAAIDPEGAAGSIYFAMHVSMLVMESLHKAAEQDGIAFPSDAEYSQSVERFNELCEEFKARLSFENEQSKNGDSTN